MDLKLLDEKLDTIKEETHNVQKSVDEMGVKIEEHEGLKGAVEKVEEAIQAIQEEHQKDAGEKAALANTVKELEGAIARGVAKGTGEDLEIFKEYGDEFNRYIKKGVAPSKELIEDVCKGIVEREFKGADAEEIANEVKTMVAGSNPAGGYWVRPEVSARLIQRIFETSPLRAVAGVQTISSKSIEITIDDEEAEDGGWVGELDERDTTGTPEIGQLEIFAHEIFAEPKATEIWLEDSAIDGESWLMGKSSRKISRSENTAFIVGNGAKRPKGLLSYPDAASLGTYERGAIQTRTSSVSASFNADDLKLLQNDLKEEWQPNAIWGMKRNSFGTVITLKDADGQYIFQSRFINERDDQMLLGRRIIFMNDIPDLASDSLSVIYGDFSEGYLIVDRLGFSVKRDDITEKQFVKFYTRKRTGGDVTNYDSWNRLRCAA